MHIDYFGSFSRGWERMKEILFRPRSFDRWFYIGFSAWLAGLMHGTFPNNSFSWKDHLHGVDRFDMASIPRQAVQWLTDNPLYTVLIFSLVLFVIGLWVLLTWLSSRGKFMFLHNVVNNNTENRYPWHTYREEGRSLFLWRLAYGAIAIGFFLMMISGIFALFVTGASSGQWALPGFLLLMVFVIFLYSTVTGYISLFLNDFIVPLMYRYRSGANAAWRRFLPLMWQHLGHFILYGLFIFFLWFVVIFAVVILSIMTCCIGGLVLMIPYIGSVLMLPVSVTFRSLSLHFLAQFGEAFTLEQVNSEEPETIEEKEKDTEAGSQENDPQ